MKYLLALTLLVSLLLSACGTVTVRGALNGGDTAVASGMVSIVRLTFASDGNSTITVTVVTLSQSGSAQTLTFCGSQASLFPMDASVTARFTAGSPCSTLIAVTANTR